MKFQELPHEILFQICHHLNLIDFAAFSQVSELASRTHWFFKFYHDESEEAKPMAVQLQQRCPFKIESLYDFPEDGITGALMIHILAGNPSDKMLERMENIKKSVPNVITAVPDWLDSSIFTSILEYCPMTKLVSIMNVLSAQISHAEWKIDPQIFEFPKLEQLELQDVRSINNTKFQLPMVKEIDILCGIKQLPILQNLQFDSYKHLELLRLDLFTSMESVTLDSVPLGNCSTISLNLQNQLNTKAVGILKNLVLPNVQNLKLTSFYSFVNIDAPELEVLDLSIHYNKSFIFQNFNAPKLLRITTHFPFEDEEQLHFEKFENVHFPKLQEFQRLNESSFDSAGSFSFEELQIIECTGNFRLWVGRFNSLVLKKLELGCAFSLHGNTYKQYRAHHSALCEYQYSFPLLEDLQISFRPYPLAFFDLPFVFNLPKLTHLFITNVEGVTVETLNQLFLNSPKLSGICISLVPEEHIKIDGVNSDSMESLSLSIEKTTDNHLSNCLFELTNCYFPKLSELSLFMLDDMSLNIDNVITPCLKKFRAMHFFMESINFSKMNTPCIEDIFFDGFASEIELGDIENVKRLGISSFDKLSYTKEPLELKYLMLPSNEEIEHKGSKKACERLHEIKSRSPS